LDVRDHFLDALDGLGLEKHDDLSDEVHVLVVFFFLLLEGVDLVLAGLVGIGNLSLFARDGLLPGVDVALQFAELGAEGVEVGVQVL